MNLMTRSGAIATLALLSCLLVASCGGLSGEQTEKLDGALSALERLSAATDVGVNDNRYGELVIEAQAAVNEAARVLPEAELSGALERAMEAHVDARNVWEWKLTHVAIRTGRDPGTKVIPEYSIPSELRTDRHGEEYRTADQDLALQMIWAEADERHARLLALAGR